jgi:hypothetical protein
MQFVPSKYSHAGDEYDGWFSNLFTREGRAENKATRAERKRAKGRDKAAERLERRSGILEAKAKGKAGTLSQKSDFADLWADPFPFAGRKRVPGGTISGTAKGFRPSRSQVRQEFRATITGGLNALKLAGIDPYTTVDVESLPQALKQLKAKDAVLVGSVESLTGKDYGGSLQKASRAVRKIVIANRLGGVAWPARAAQMLKAGAKRATVGTTGLAATAKALQVAAASAAAASPGPQGMFTLPSAAVLQAATYVTAGLAAASSAKAAANEAQAAKYEQLMLQELQAWGGEQKARQATAQVRDAQRRLVFQRQVAERVGEIRGSQTAEAIKVIAVSGAVSAVILLGATLMKQARA